MEPSPPAPSAWDAALLLTAARSPPLAPRPFCRLFLEGGSLTTINMQSLVTVGSSVVFDKTPALKELSADSIVTIADSLVIRDTSLSPFNGMKALTCLGADSRKLVTDGNKQFKGRVTAAFEAWTTEVCPGYVEATTVFSFSTSEALSTHAGTTTEATSTTDTSTTDSSTTTEGGKTTPDFDWTTTEPTSDTTTMPESTTDAYTTTTAVLS